MPDQDVTTAHHTPGPWVMRMNHAGVGYRIEDRPGRVQIAPRISGIGGRKSAEAKANARLIAAAPQMASLLRDLRGVLGAVGATNSDLTPIQQGAIAKLDDMLERLPQNPEPRSGLDRLERGLDSLANQIDALEARIEDLEEEIDTLEQQQGGGWRLNTLLRWMTSHMDEHPEGWEGPCECATCRSYAAQDEGWGGS